MFWRSIGFFRCPFTRVLLILPPRFAAIQFCRLPARLIGTPSPIVGVQVAQPDSLSSAERATLYLGKGDQRTKAESLGVELGALGLSFVARGFGVRA